MPLLGLGVFQLKEKGEVETAVKAALLTGYRSIDTASAYHNEKGVARGIAASGVPRSEIFLTTKIKNSDQGYQSATDAFYKSLDDLQTDYLDLLLIHWPMGKKSLKSWKAMEELYEKGSIRAIGVSNFKIHHLEYLLTDCKYLPAVNQVEYHPKHSQPRLVSFCKKHNIQIEAWSPLMRGEVVNLPLIIKLARKYNKTPAQIVLRWNLQNQIITIPKSASPHRIIDNANIFDFVISEQDMHKINQMNKDHALVNYRDRTTHLLQMIQKHTFNKHFIRSLTGSILRRKTKTPPAKNFQTMNPAGKTKKVPLG